MAKEKLIKPYTMKLELAFIGCEPKHLEAVERCATVDAVEVVHGRWILREKAGVDYWCCSVCDKIRSEYYFEPKDNYCPNCGAKMDGDGNG